MEFPKGNKVNIFPDDMKLGDSSAVTATQITYDIATQLDGAQIEKIINNLQWVLVGMMAAVLPPRPQGEWR
jgi:hypothetical protein